MNIAIDRAVPVVGLPEGFHLVGRFQDRDLARTTLVNTSSGLKLTVTKFACQPNFLDASYAIALPCGSEIEELNLRRSLDEFGDDHPFVRTRIEVQESDARVELALMHELPENAAARDALQQFYFKALVAAATHLQNTFGHAQLDEAA